MAAPVDIPRPPAAPPSPWYSCPTVQVEHRLGVDRSIGLSATKAAELLKQNGRNELPEERPRSAWLRTVDEYRSFMQLILSGAAIVSLLIQEWSTAVLLILLTVL